jgi:DNA-binding Lrp family transcriptional regulator
VSPTALSGEPERCARVDHYEEVAFLNVVTPDPVDVRLLSLVAEAGRAAVHEVAARLGMDPREVAARLVALSANGLPLMVGVECDPNGIRQALAAMAPPPPPPANYPSGAYQVQGTPSGTYPPPPPPQMGTPSGVYQVAPPSGAYQVQQPYPPQPPRPAYPPSQPFATQPPPPPQPMAPPDPVASTWGPPQSASWARGDQPPRQPGPAAPTRPPTRRTGKAGETLEAEGLEGEYLAIQLVEVVDPADFLFTAAGYRLQEGERSVVVHTEMVNKGPVPFNSLPDMYLVLVTKDGQTISKAPVSLSSRPPHRIGVAPGETAGGHTVYVLSENIDVTAVRWSPRPDDTAKSLTWTVEP